mgnify:CR=1 FL=1
MRPSLSIVNVRQVGSWWAVVGGAEGGLYAAVGRFRMFVGRITEVLKNGGRGWEPSETREQA